LATKIQIGVLFGGRSTEHQVSLVSATSVMQALDREKYDIIPIGITLSGQWLVGKEALPLLKEGKSDERLLSFLPPDPNVKRLALMHNLTFQETQIDVLLSVLHGTFGEDGAMQGLFEVADIPYVGANVLGSSAAMDKIVQKQICDHAGLPSVDYVWLRGIDWLEKSSESVPVIENLLANMTQKEMLDAVAERLGFPVFIKPPNLGSSVGISKASTIQELEDGINVALRYDAKVLIEKAVVNAREIEVAVLGNEHPKTSVAGEVIPSNDFYDYDAKYVDNASKLVIPAQLPDDLQQTIRESAIKSVIAVQVEGMARVDFLLDNKTNDFYLNEINTLPGFTSISMYPKLWAATGLPYSDLLDELIRLALDRHEKKKALKTAFTPTAEWYR
jgi:D-alanine-D-alanine ligase